MSNQALVTPKHDFKINLISLGSGSIGKTALVKRYLCHQFVEDYKPTGVEQLSTVVKVGNGVAGVCVWDIGVSKIHLEMVKKILSVCNIFLLCFSISDESSFQYIRNLWESTLKHYRTKETYFCLVGLKGDLRGQISTIPEERIEAFSQEIQANYIESSSKKNERIQDIFNSGLIYHYRRVTPIDVPKTDHTKESDRAELYNLFKNEVPCYDVLSNHRLRQVLLELFKNRDAVVIQYLSSYECLDSIIDYFLIDPNQSTEASSLSESAGVILDSKIESILTAVMDNLDLIDKLFSTFFSHSQFSKLNITKQHQLVRLLMWLFDANFLLMSDYAIKTELVNKLLENISQETKYELLYIILNREKKIQDDGNYRVDGLLQGIDLSQTFSRLLTCNPPAIVLCESLSKLIIMTTGNNFIGLLNTIDYNDYFIVQTVIGLIKNPDTCHDAVSLLCDCILVVHAGNTSEPLRSYFTGILSQHQDLFHSLITSSSKIIQHNGLKLLDHFLRKKCENLVKPHLLTCLDIFFTTQRGNVIHNTVSEMVNSVFNCSFSSDLALLLLKTGNIADRILTAYESRKSFQDKEQYLYYGHLAKMAKSMMESNFVVENEEILKSERWKYFYQNFVLVYVNQKELLPPSLELRSLKQRQLMRSGIKTTTTLASSNSNSFSANSKRGVGPEGEA